MRKIRRSKKRGPVVSKKVTYDGINFASGLEKYMYIALKQNSIKAKYEKRTFVLIPEFYFNNESYEFARISDDNQSGSIPIAALDVSTLDDDIEHKLRVEIGNGEGERLDEELLSRLSIAISIPGVPAISPFELESTVLEIYYEDITL